MSDTTTPTPAAKPSASTLRLVRALERAVMAELGKGKRPATRARNAHELLEALPAVSATVRALQADSIRAMRDEGMTWAQIGAELGVGSQRAQQLARVTLEEALR